MKLFKRTTLILTMLLIGLPVTVQAAAKKELKIGITQEFENMNPLISSMLATTYLQYFVARHMVVLSPEGNWEPTIVKTIPTLENGLAKKTDDGKLLVTWEFREDAKWGDGKPITAEDFAFTREVALNPNVSLPERDGWQVIEKVDIDPKNPKKMTLTYKEQRWNFNKHLIRIMPLPKHLEEPIFNKFKNQPEGYDKNSLYTTSPTTPGLYYGPYVVSEIKLGSHVSFTPNKYYYGKKPNIEKITVKLIPNTATLEANLRSGSIDMISQLGFSFDQALAFEKKVKKEKYPFEVVFKQSLTYEHIDLNLDNEFLKDINVRKALVYAINRDELTKALFDGRQKKAIHNIVPIDPWYTDDKSQITLYPFSRRKAKKLLEQAGWKKGEDGYLYKDGKKLSFQLMTTAGNKVRELVETYLQEQWKKVGIEITIKNEQPRVYFGDTTRTRKFPAMAMYAWISTPESLPKSQLHSTMIPTKENSFSGQNYPGYANPEMDKLIDALEIEFDATKRKELASKILKLYTDDVPVIPLYYRADIAVIPNYMKNFVMTGTQYPNSMAAERWDISSAKIN